MGIINDSLLAIAQIKTLLKDSINRLVPNGITNDTPFRQYVTVLDNYTPDVGGIHDVINFNDILSEKVYEDAVYSESNLYTITGTLTNNNEVFSGFTGSNYLRMEKRFPSSWTTAEIGFKFKVPDNTTVKTLFEIGGSPRWHINHLYRKIAMWSDYDGDFVGTTILQDQQYYWVKVIINKNNNPNIELYLSSDGTNYGLEASMNFSYFERWSSTSYNKPSVGARVNGSDEPFTGGTIDLNESYVKIDGELYWQKPGEIITPEIDYYYYNPLEGGEE